MGADYAAWGEEQRRFLNRIRSEPASVVRTPIRLEWEECHPFQDRWWDPYPFGLLRLPKALVRVARRVRDGVNFRLRPLQENRIVARFHLDPAAVPYRGRGYTEATLVTTADRFHFAVETEHGLIAPTYPVSVKFAGVVQGWT